MLKKYFLVFAVYLISLQSSAKNDAVGEKERNFLDSGDSVHCEKIESILDKFGCLQADGKTARHCLLRLIDNNSKEQDSPCPEEMITQYLCKDYALCMKKEDGKNPNPVKPLPKDKGSK
jgi:hypothetical protein